jgi:L-serine dehydratase
VWVEGGIVNRRNFCKLAVLSSVGVGSMLLNVNLSRAKGIPSGAFPGRGTNQCYAGSPKGVILTSLSDLFKIGPGPSSSHTIAPLRIAEHFRQTMEELSKDEIGDVQSIEVRLFGSLSATGRGHHTDRAIMAGLLGQKAETCDTKLMDQLQDAAKKYPARINGKTFMISHDMIIWDKIEHTYPYANTMIMRLVGKDGSTLFEREYYSPGGGFFLWKGQPEADRGKPVYPYHSMTQFKALARENRKSLHEIILENEKAIMKVGEQEINAHLDMVIKIMLDGVKQGLREEGLIPAPFAFYRKAKRIFERSRRAKGGDGFMGRLSSYALAVSERNAAGRLAVTAPTLGSAGTMPAIVTAMKQMKLSQDAMRKGLMAAGLVGFLCKNNASVAGAEVGCQGEIGVASAMAAAMITYATGASLEATEVAATIALEHHLGMSCDPVGGFVLIPCIERNAFGALKAYNAYLLATNEITSQHWEDLDRVIMAMLETGRALPTPFKEMGTGGLGITMVDC